MTMGPDTTRPRDRLTRKLVMPDLVGMKVRDALILLRNAGFGSPTADSPAALGSIARIRYVEAYAAEDIVVGQSPVRGLLTDRDAPVELRCARSSLLHYLPNIYQQAPDGERHFLREFLWIFQHGFDGLRQRIDDVPRLLRPTETDPEFLPWLAGWLALQLELDWPELRKRRWLRLAPRLFTIRGTARALRELLEIYTGVRPRIDENRWPYKGFRIGIASSVGIDTVVLPPMNLSHCFMVHLPIPYDEVSEETVVRIHRLIQAEKPSHTTYFLTFQTESRKAELRNFMQIGISSAIGAGE